MLCPVEHQGHQQPNQKQDETKQLFTRTPHVWRA
uniref:Uncharacterized protein n=1 Tax=Setaria italica TaxID=4555 RepID=K3Z1Y1_SETIT